MLRRHQQFYLQVLQIVDSILLASSFWFAHVVRFDVPPYDTSLWILVLMIPLGPLILELNGFYRMNLLHNLRDSLVIITRSIVFLLLAIFTVLFAFKVPQDSVSRGVFSLFVPFGILGLSIREMAFQRWQIARRKSVMTRQHILLCGNQEDRSIWKKRLLENPGSRFFVRSEVDLRETSLTDFIALLHTENIDVAVFNLDHSLMSEINNAIAACEMEGVEVWVTADFFRTALTKPRFDQFGGQSLLIFRSTPDSSWELLIKRILDRIMAFILLILLSPLFLAIALAIYWTSGFPIIFSQRRSGIHGRPFVIYKFRTMISNAEQAQQELKAFNEMSGPVFKMAKDPRITPLGAWLRKTSLDELPQLWNVLRGEMSMVGPRPLPVYETECFSDFAQRRRMSVRPGLTCLWQIAGRNEIRDFTDWVRLDLAYIDQWSLWLDFKILLRTIPVVLFGRGAK